MGVGFGLGITNLFTVERITAHSEGLTVSNLVADKRPGLAFRRSRSFDFLVQLGVNDEITVNATSYNIAAGLYASLAALATAIQTAISATSITVTYDSTRDRFIFSRATGSGTYTVHTNPGTGAWFIGFPGDGTTEASVVVGSDDVVEAPLAPSATGMFVIYDCGASGVTPDAVIAQIGGDDVADYTDLRLYASNTLHGTTEQFAAWDASAPFSETFTARADESPNKLQAVLTLNSTAYRYWAVFWITPQTNQTLHDMEIIRAYEVDAVAAGIAAPTGAGPKDSSRPLGPGNYYPMAVRKHVGAELTFPTWKEGLWRSVLSKLVHLAGKTEPVLVGMLWTQLLDATNATVASSADIATAIAHGQLFYGVAQELPEEDYAARGHEYINGSASFRQLV